MPSVEVIVKEEFEADLAEQVLAILSGVQGSPKRRTQAWRTISKHVLQPHHPQKLHRLLHDAVFDGWNSSTKGPAGVWLPTAESARDTNLARFMQKLRGSQDWDQGRTGDPAADYPLLQLVSWREPELFWPQLMQQLGIRFHQPYSRVYEHHVDPDKARWLPEARFNIAECALMGRDPDAPAVLWAPEDDPEHVRTISLGKLRHESQDVAAALRRKGLKPGDAVGICMPMTAAAVAAYLGIVLAGCAVVGIADSFAPTEIAARLRIGSARLVITQDCTLRDGKRHPLFERVTGRSDVPAVVLPFASSGELQVKLRSQDATWQEFLGSLNLLISDDFEPHWAAADEVTNVLFSSGTTGDPKAIPWTHVTPIRAATDAFAQQDVRKGDTVAFPTNLGWMMGPFLIYAALLNGAAMAIFQGSPLGRPFCKFVAAARVSMLGVIPSIVRAWRNSDCIKGLDWGCIRCFSSTGEASSPDDCFWLMSQAGYKPVLELCGGTELGGAFLSGSLLQPQVPSVFSMPTLGSRVVLLGSEDGKAWQSEHGSGETAKGELAVLPPFLGASQKLLNAEHHKVYYQDMPVAASDGRTLLRRHGDFFERLPGGYYCAHGRSDDTMNLGGIKVSAVELERVLVQNIAAVSEAAAVAYPEPGGGPDKLAMFIVASGGHQSADREALQRECQAAIREHINPLFKISKVVIVADLPRTATNKVQRRLLRARLETNAKL